MCSKGFYDFTVSGNVGKLAADDATSLALLGRIEFSKREVACQEQNMSTELASGVFFNPLPSGPMLSIAHACAQPQRARSLW